MSSTTIRPRYIETYRRKQLSKKIEQGRQLLEDCILCPQQCKVNRFEEPGTTCETGHLARVSSYFPHFGEEACITGRRGSGTIFFTSCNLRCLFCQNWDISHSNAEREASPEELANIMLHLQEIGCHNINFVTPSHVVVPILDALLIAIEGGLQIPIVYNTSAYDSAESLELLDGIVDIYMPDFKFWSKDSSQRYLKAPDYPEVARRNFQLMLTQVGDLVIDDFGIAVRGLLVRHLVMPNHEQESQKILAFLANEISKETVVNVMFQYRPNHEIGFTKYPEINRCLTHAERTAAMRIAAAVGLHRFA